MSQLSWDDIRDRTGNITDRPMDDNDINIDIDAESRDAWRLNRLNQVIGFVAALADHYGNKRLLGKVSHLYDHKGDLTVTWKKQPTDGEKEFFLKAWESRIGDGAGNVVHEVKSTIK